MFRTVWHIPDAVCTALDSRWWTERPSETCRVLLQNKINLRNRCISLVLLRKWFLAPPNTCIMLKIWGATVQKFGHPGDQGLGRVEQCRLQLLWKQLQDRTASSVIPKAIQNTYSWPSTFTSVSGRWEGVHDGRWTLSLTDPLAFPLLCACTRYWNL
jgi:hypothetical protein